MDLIRLRKNLFPQNVTILILMYIFSMPLCCYAVREIKPSCRINININIRAHQVAQPQFVNVIITLLNSDNLQVPPKHLLANK